MNFRSFEKTDRKIISIGAVLLLLSSLLLWQDDWIFQLVQTRKHNSQKIGEIKVIKNDVRRRLEVALSWLPLRKQSDVYQGDSIFTGDNSSIEIETTSGERITIAPNSMIVINQRKDSMTLSIGFGSVEGQMQNGKKLFISSNNKLTEISGTDGKIRVDSGEGNNLRLNVLGGEVRIQSSSGEKILRGTDSAELLDGGNINDTSRSNIEIISPFAEQKFKNKPDEPIVFKWTTRRKYSRMKIKISTDDKFSNIVVDTRINENLFSAYNLPTDTDLYWQIIAEGGVSNVHKFAIAGERPPLPVFPKPGYQFFFSPNLSGSPVELSWEPGSIASHFEVQVANNNDFSKIIFANKTKNKSYKFNSLAAGQYYWRVRSIDFPNEQWSAPSAFKVGLEPVHILAAPLPQLAENIFLIPTKIHNLDAKKFHAITQKQTKKYIENYPRLRWSSVSGADKYIIEISKDKNFKKIISTKATSMTNFNWKNIEPGTYFWRTQAAGENFKGGLYSQVQKINISVQPPQALSQSLIVEEVPDPELLKAAPPPLKISWNPTIFTQFYEVEFSSKTDFKNPTRFITNSSTKQVQISAPGVYYWRIRSLDQDQRPTSPYSSAYTIELQRIYKDPTKNNNLLAIYPKQQDSIVLIGSAQSELEFKWTKPYPDSNYRIELSDQPDFESVFFTATTKNNYLKYLEKFSKRIVYWRIRAENTDFVSDWTGANRFLVSYEGHPFDFEQSDIMFASRLKAKSREQLILADQVRRRSQLRMLASQIELQLDSPQLIDPPTQFVIESNINPNTHLSKISQLPFEKYFSQMRNYPILRWNKVPAAERYVVEIAQDKDFTQIISKTPTWNTFYSWETARPGLFYYRIQAFNERYKRSHYTPAQNLLVSVTSPLTTSPDTFVEVYDEPKEMWQHPNPIRLTWLPVIFAREYEIELSDSPKFTVAKVYKTKSTSAEIKVSRSGLYYWRVRPMNENGISIARFSPIRSLEVIQTNRQPASANTLAGVFPIDRTLLYVGEGAMNLAFHWTSPDSTSPVEVELSNTANFERILTRAQSTKKNAIISDELPDGKIYWRVKSGSILSAVNEFYLRRERKAYSPELIKTDLAN